MAARIVRSVGLSLIANSVFALSIVRVGPMVFRDNAVHVVTPEYPKSSIAANVSGPAVAEVFVSDEGKVYNVKILEAPDLAIGNALKTALSKWVFRPFRVRQTMTGPSVPTPATSRLVFYFKSIDKKAIVIDAVEEELSSQKQKRE